MESKKIVSPQGKVSQSGGETDIWASAFDVAQCVSAYPPPLQLMASSLSEAGGGKSFPFRAIIRDDAWSSGFYAAPSHDSKTHDLPKGTALCLGPLIIGHSAFRLM